MLVQIKDYPKYYIDDMGNVFRFSKKENAIVKHKDCASDHGYRFTTLCKLKSKPRRVYIHRLVMEIFCGPSDLTVDHLDENKSNNALYNLRYRTHLANIQSYWKPGRADARKKGIRRVQKHPLSAEQVMEIQSLFGKRSIYGVAKQYGVSTTKIRSLWNPKPTSRGKKRYCGCSNGKMYDSLAQAAAELNLNQSTISQVCKGNFYQTGGYHFWYIEAVEQ